MTSLRKRAEPVTLVRSPTLTKGISGVSVKASRPDSRSRGANVGDDARCLAGDGAGDGADVLGRGAAAAADDIDQAGRGEFADQLRHHVRPFVVAAELVGQSGIGIGADQRVGDAGQLGDMRAQFLGAERAIEPERQRRGMRDRVPERFRRLAGQQTAGAIGDGAGNHHRHDDAPRFKLVGDGENRGLGVERVEDGLDQQRIDAAGQEPAHLLGVSEPQLVEGDGAKARIGNVRRDRGGAVGRAERAGDETLAAVFILGEPRRLAGEPRAFRVQFIGDLGHAVIGLRDAGRGKRIGGDDVGAGAEIFEVDGAHRLRPAEIEEIVVAAHFAVPGVEAGAAKAFLVEPERLDHRAHGAVEHENALSGEAAQRGFGFGTRDGSAHLRALLFRLRMRTRCIQNIPAAARANGRSHKPGRRGSWCRSGNR